MDKISPIKERILKYIEYSGITKQLFCEKTGISYANIKGKSLKSEIGGVQIGEILSVFSEISPDWLLTGRGKMLRSESKQAIYSISEFKQHGYAPYYSELKVSAGQYDLAVIEKNEEPESWIKFPGIIAEAWFPIIGCSMEPKIYAGDTLGVVKIEHWEKVDPDKIYLVITIYDRMIKQLVVDENSNEYLWAVSLNHPRIKVLYSEIITIYRVVWAGRLV